MHCNNAVKLSTNCIKKQSS